MPQFDFSQLPQPWSTVIPILLGAGLLFAAKAATTWLRGRAKTSIEAAEKELMKAAAAMHKALETADPEDDKAAQALLEKCKERAASARESALKYEAIAKGIESLQPTKLK